MLLCGYISGRMAWRHYCLPYVYVIVLLYECECVLFARVPLAVDGTQENVCRHGRRGIGFVTGQLLASACVRLYVCTCALQRVVLKVLALAQAACT